MSEAEIEAALSTRAGHLLTRDEVIDILEAAERARLIEFTCTCGKHFEVKSQSDIVGR